MGKPKKGRVIRVTPDLQAIIEVEQLEGESIPDVLRRLLGLTGEVRYVLPGDIHETIEDARGAAVLKAVKTKGERRLVKPIPVRRVE